MCKRQEQLLRPSHVLTMFPEFPSMAESDKTRLRKTAYYRQRITPEPITNEEIERLTIPQIWELTRVSISTIHRWKSGKIDMPYATQQLLKYCIYGIIPQGFGNWGGSHFARDGKLYPLYSAIGYTPHELQGFYLVANAASRVPGLERQIEKIEAELYFHKHQTKENSRMGFMRGLVEWYVPSFVDSYRCRFEAAVSNSTGLTPPR